MKYANILRSFCFAGCLVASGTLFAQSDSQTLLFNIPEIKLLALPNVTIDLSMSETDFALSETGLSTSVVTKSDSSQYAFFTLAQGTALRITGELDAALPAGMLLRAEMGSDGSSVGTPSPTSSGLQGVTSTSSIDLLTNIGNGVYSSATLTYELDYDVSTLDLDSGGSSTVTVVYTITL
jgi:hypothetical protein